MVLIRPNELAGQSDALLREQQAIEKKLSLLKLEEEYLQKVKVSSGIS